jgi:hypothetical protein
MENKSIMLVYSIKDVAHRFGVKQKDIRKALMNLGVMDSSRVVTAVNDYVIELQEDGGDHIVVTTPLITTAGVGYLQNIFGKVYSIVEPNIL